MAKISAWMALVAAAAIVVAMARQGAFSDFGAVQSNFGKPANPVTGIGDSDCNGFVNFVDFGAVQSAFGGACP